MSSLTEDKIAGAIVKAQAELEVFYDRIFKKMKLIETTWKEILTLEARLTEDLEERPLTSMAIRALMVNYTKAFKKLCLDAKDSGGVVERSGTPAG